MKMPSAGNIADHLKEAVNILRAYQFPQTQRADLALAEIEKARKMLEEWKDEAIEFADEYGRESQDTSAKHIR